MEIEVRWHIAPADADWTDHPSRPDGFCEAHMDLAARGDVPYGGWFELRKAGEGRAGDLRPHGTVPPWTVAADEVEGSPGD